MSNCPTTGVPSQFCTCVQCQKPAEPVAASQNAAYARPCTCHPDDNPPVPCAQQYALTECRAKAGATSPADPHVKSPLPAQAGGAPVTPSALESALARIKQCTQGNSAFPWVELSCNEAAALLQRLEAADSIPDGHLAAIAREAGFTEQQFASLFYNDGPYEITTPTATLRCFVSAILAYRNPQPVGGGE